MTEVQTSINQGKGLYATQAYQPGDVILDESPLFTFQPTTKEQSSTIRSQFKALCLRVPAAAAAAAGDDYDYDSSSQTCLHDLKIPSSIHANKHSKFLGMVTAAASYAISTNIKISSTSSSSTIQTKLNELYHPLTSASTSTSDADNVNKYEQEIILLAKAVISFLATNTIPSTPLHTLVKDKEEECINMMLVWSCNAFKGGHVYDIISRINHSCDFNAVISVKQSDPKTSTKNDGDDNDNNNDDDDDDNNQTNNEKQIVKATSVIEPGDQINISYLGSYTYAGMSQRKKLLRKDKYFDCQCKRCTDECTTGDVASATPCIKCHERVNGRYLDEDVQYDDDDDENEVKYALPKGSGPDNTVYTCQKCDCDDGFTLDTLLNDTIEKTIEKVITHLNECENNIRGGGDDGGDDDYDVKEEEMAEMTERLICLSYSVLGAKHYCTNLLLVQSLGKKLSALHSSMLWSITGQKGKKKGGDDNDTGLDMNEIAECIDSLERLFKFVKGLNLMSHPGHLLGNATIGVSRVLIGLGDIKSMKFGAEWAEKVHDYFSCGFEGAAMEKVVETLLNAWKRKADQVEPDGKKENKKKRIKL